MTREITLDGQMETPKRFGVTREVTLNRQGGIKRRRCSVSGLDKGDKDADAGEVETPRT